MLLQEHPQLIIAFHTCLPLGSGGTSDMCLRGLVGDVPAWLVTGPDPDAGRWLLLDEFPRWRRERVGRELTVAQQAGLAVAVDNDANETE
jgi:hypothetical protein